MSYTTRIKNEIAEIESTKSEMIAEISGFIRNNGYIENNILYLTTENTIILNRLIEYITYLYDVKPKISSKNNLNFSKNKLNLLIIEEKVDFILEDIGYYSKDKKYLSSPPNYIVGSNEEIRAYLRGVFLCQGSINDPKTSYHMELLIDKPEEGVELNAKILTRNNGYMIYIKEADKISDYLKILRANKAVLYFEDIRIYHEEKNKANRLNNCEQANIDKVIQTANDQLNYIKIIEENMGKELLDEKTREALEYRKKYPETSLKELSEIISIETGKPITKSGLNHRFRKIKELATKFQNS